MKTTVPAILSLKTAGLLALVGSSLLLANRATAAPLATDSFATTTDGTGGTYSTATLDSRIYGQNPTSSVSGFDTAWLNATNASTAAMRVETTGLTHSLLQGTAAAGDAFGSKGNVTRTVTRGLDSTVDSNIAAQEAASGEIWFSTLTMTTGMNTGGSFLGLSANVAHDVAPTNGLQIYTGSGQIRLFNGATQVGTGVSITSGVTYLVTVKIDLTAGGPANDSVTLEIYSPTATVGNPTATISGTGLTLTAGNLGYLTMYQTNTSAYTSNATTPRFDEFRLGLTQGDVMAIPEPNSIALLGLGLGTLLMARPRRRRVS
jgi:hypothetical protein